jgi:hypothetical protein
MLDRSTQKRTLDDYADAINAEWRESVDGIFRIGKMLIEAEGDGFTADLYPKLTFGMRTAQRLKPIARDERLATHVSLLPASWGTLYALSELSDEMFTKAVAKKVIHPGMERADVKDLVSELKALDADGRPTTKKWPPPQGWRYIGVWPPGPMRPCRSNPPRFYMTRRHKALDLNEAEDAIEAWVRTYGRLKGALDLLSDAPLLIQSPEEWKKKRAAARRAAKKAAS